jgi:hypothetical protein
VDGAEKVVARYLQAINDHDIDSALDCLADDFELRFAGSSFVMSKEGAAQAIGWDAGANGRLAWHVADSRGEEVTVHGRESNEFLELVGIGSLRFRSSFQVSDTGIRSQFHEVDWDAVPLEAAMKPLLDWAAEHDPDEVAELRPEGRMVYTRESAERWVDLARRWRDATAV